MLTTLKDALLNKEFGTKLTQNIVGAVVVTTITTVLPVVIKIGTDALTAKIEEMKEQKLANEAHVEANAQ